MESLVSIEMYLTAKTRFYFDDGHEILIDNVPIGCIEYPNKAGFLSAGIRSSCIYPNKASHGSRACVIMCMLQLSLAEKFKDETKMNTNSNW